MPHHVVLLDHAVPLERISPVIVLSPTRPRHFADHASKRARAFRLRRAELSEPDCHLTGDFGYWIGQMIKGEALAHLLGLQLGDIVQN
ncbi:MAG: hypothetical protein DMG57_40940 [Acidobacteria bacterium]|nr:MAG: hypothetical protein DMG57_40940 [Acidobacteriota bacterium]